MAGPAQRLSLGPWPSGMDILERDAQKDANQDPSIVINCVNLDFTDEGYLVSRPGAQRVGTKSVQYTDATRECRVLGSVYEAGSVCAVLGIVVSGANTKIYLTDDGYNMYYWGSVAGALTSVQQYLNTIYLIIGDTGTPTTGGYTIASNFFGGAGFTAPNAAVGVSMPSGDKTFVFKDRMFIIHKSSSTIWYSAPTDPLDYTSPVDAPGTSGGAFTIEPTNDAGTDVFDVALTNETFYIFKRNKTFLFTYDQSPGSDSVVRLINSALGGFSATVWENDVYVVNTQGVYRIVNGVFIRLDTRLDLRINADLANIIDPDSLARPLFIHAFTGRLMVGQFSGTLSRYGWNYVTMNLTTGAWSGYAFQSSNNVAPGAAGATAQKDDTWGLEIFPSKDRQFFTRIASQKGALDIAMDGNSNDATELRYLPPFSLKLPVYNAGISSVWKKLHRFFVRGRWAYQAGTMSMNPVILSVTYDDNATLKDSTNWTLGSPWETGGTTQRPQSEFKATIKQNRFRNLAVAIDCAGSSAGYSVSIPPNAGRFNAYAEMYLTGIDLDISLPRGQSSR